MSVREFLDITPVEFYDALKDNDEYEISKIKPVCEAIRMEAWWLVNAQMDKRHRIRKKERIMTFPWDKENVRKPQTKVQMISVMKTIGRSNTNPNVMGARQKRLQREKERRKNFINKK